MGKIVCPIGSARASSASDFAHLFIRRIAGAISPGTCLMIASCSVDFAAEYDQAVYMRMIGSRNSVPINRKACVLGDEAACHSV